MRGRTRPVPGQSPLAVQVPVGIVGGSVAGLALACGLAAQGVPCTVLDEGSGEDADRRPAVLGPRALEALARWGGAAPVRAAGVCLRRVRIRYRGETLGYLPTAELPTRHPVLVSLEEGVLRRTLADQARRSGLVEVRPPGRVVGLQARADRSRVLLADGSCSRFRFLAAACPDLRRLLGMALLGNQPPLPRFSGIAPEAARDEFELFLGVSGMAWTYPRPTGPAALAAEAWYPDVNLRDFREDLGLPVRSSLVAEPPAGETGFSATLQVGPLVLLGGAARSLPPGAWRSRDLDVAEAEALAWRVAAVLRGAPGDLMAGYELERRPRSLAMAALGPAWLPRLCRPGAMKLLAPLLRAGSVRNGLGEALAGLSGCYPPSSWCVEARAGRRPAPRPGMRLPEVRYEDESGRRCWLQDLAPARVLVLRFGEGPARDGYRVSRRRRGPGLLHDADGSLERALQGRPGEVMIVRPDGVVGYRAWPEDPRRTAAWLSQLGPREVAVP